MIISNFIVGEVNVDVMVPATVEFHDEFAFYGEVQVQLESTVTVKCDAKNGHPKPELTAAVIDADGNLIRQLAEIPELSETTVNLDDTENIKKEFILVPHMEDCGRSIQCVATQGDSTYDETRQLKVVFAPQPIEDDMSFAYMVSFLLPSII